MIGQPPPVVLVYTAPKVASTAVTQALKAIEGLAVYQVHLINRANVDKLRREMRRRGLAAEHNRIARIVELANALHAEMIKTRRPAKIVTLVREPVARNISYYFEVLDLLWKAEHAHEQVGVGPLVAEFYDRFTHDRGINWFDNEFKPMLGIDVYEHPFPHELRFLRIDAEPYDVLIMRHDLDDREKEKCLADLIGVPTVTLSPKNVSSEKAYSAAYREFLNRINLPEQYVDELLNSKYARHFFSAEELRQVRAKWLNGNREPAATDLVSSPSFIRAAPDRIL